MTYRDYALVCIGHNDRKLTHMRELRKTQWLLFVAVKDPKKPPFSMLEWWPIDPGDKTHIYIPTPEEIRQFDLEFRSLGKKKQNG